VVPSDDELADLVAELRALRDTASRADALAVRVGDRIEGLEGAEERADRLEREQAEHNDRIAQLQRDLDAAKATSDELDGRLAGVGDAATELNAATETLRELQRALEQTVAR
jgi:chromosome segregation ATPase